MPDWSHEEFLTVAEVAERLKITQQSVRNWVADGKLPALRVGRRVRVLRSDFDRLIATSERRVGATPEPAPAANGEAFWSGELVQEAVVGPLRRSG